MELETKDNTKKLKIIAEVLFWATLFLPLTAFAVACAVGETYIFNVAGAIRYSWVAWLLVPISVLSVVVGIKLKNADKKYLKNVIAVAICVPLVVGLGCCRFIFADITYDVDTAKTIASQTGVEIPDELKVATMPWADYTATYAKIKDDQAKTTFENAIKTNELWKTGLMWHIKILVPFMERLEIDKFEYFVFYNSTSDKYNEPPTAVGEYNCFFIAYDVDFQRFVMVHDFTVVVNPKQ